MRARPLASILVLACALRLAAVLWLSDTVPYSDAAYYHLAAQKLAADWKFAFDRSQAAYYGKLDWWPPLYPAFLSVIYRLFGANDRAAVFVQVLLGTFVVALVHRIGQRAGGPAVANVAAVLVAVNPTYVFLTNILASENLFVAWLALGLWGAGRIWVRGPEAGMRAGREARVRSALGARHAVLAGIGFGLGALTRAVGVLVPVVVALASRRRAATRRAWLVGSAWLVGTSAIAIAPWTLRNALVAGSPALVCFGGGLNFYYGHNDAGLGYRDLAQTPMAHLATQAEIDREGYRLGFANLARRPFGFVTRGVRKLGALFAPPSYAPHANSAILLPDGWQTDPEKGRLAAELRARQRAKNRLLDGLFAHAAALHSYLLLAGALLALVGWRHLTGDLRVAVWLCAYWILAHVVVWAQPRFRYPMEIPMALLAAFALVTWKQRRGHGARAGRIAAAIGALPAATTSALATRLVGVRVLLFGALLGTLAGCAPAPPPVPSLEPWGDQNQPYDDAIEVAAVNALGHRPADYEHTNPAPIRLGEFLLQDGGARAARQSVAERLVEQADTWRRMSGVDSLAPYLEAIRVDPSCAVAYERAVRIALARHTTSRAHALAAQGLRLDPQRGRLWAAMGEIYRREDDLHRAQAALEYALALDPALDPSTYAALAALYLRAGQVERADSLSHRAPIGSSTSLRAYIAGVQARERGDLETARRSFAEAARDSSAAVAVVVDWGHAEYAVGHLETAELAYRRALRRNPDESAALNGLGVVQRTRGDLRAATATFQRLTTTRPRDGAAQFNLAGSSLEAAQRAGRGALTDSLHGLYAIADAAFAACVDLGYRAPEARVRRAEVRLLRGDPAAAYQEARALISDPEQGGAARLLAGRAALAARRPQDAVVVLAPAYQADSLGADGLDLLGKAYLQLEMPQYAVPVLRRAHERRPDDWKTATNFAVALSESGDLAAAEALLRPLAVRHPDDADILQNLAAVLQRRGQRDEASHLLQRVRMLRER